jgi:hypothetical protein
VKVGEADGAGKGCGVGEFAGRAVGEDIGRGCADIPVGEAEAAFWQALVSKPKASRLSINRLATKNNCLRVFFDRLMRLGNGC